MQYNYNTIGITRPKARPDTSKDSSSSTSGIMSNTSSNDDNDEQVSFFDRIANLFSDSGADLPATSSTDDDSDSGASFYQGSMFTAYDGGSDNSIGSSSNTDTKTAVDSALYEALGVDVPEAYEATLGEAEPEPNIDMDVLQKALQPDPITVEGLADRNSTPVLDMAELAKQDAQEQAAIRDAMGITSEDIKIKAGDTLSAIAEDRGLPVQDVIDANPQIKNPDLIRPGEMVTLPDSPRLSESTVSPTGITTEPTVDAQAGQGIMSRPPTSEERTALSYRGPSWQKSQGLPIYKDGSFDKPTMESSLEDAGLVGKEASLLKGAIKTEVGTAGPTTENPYSLSNLEGFTGTWRQRSIDGGLLDTDGNATPLAEQLNSEGRLGDTIFDVQYAGRNGNGDIASGDGSTYKGRGLVQITGKSNYQAVQDRLAETGLNIDLMANPELVNDERYALPATLAMMDILGVNSSSADNMSAKTLNNSINSGAPRATAQERWENVVNAASPAERVALELRDEYAAQVEVGLTGRGVDGDIGTGTKARIDTWAASKGLTPPEVTEITKTSNRTGNTYQTYSPADKLKLTIFVNKNS